MKVVHGTIYTREKEKLVPALEATGLVVQEVSRKMRKGSKMEKDVVCLYPLLDKVKITTVVSDEAVGRLMETIRAFGGCKFSITS